MLPQPHLSALLQTLSKIDLDSLPAGLKETISLALEHAHGLDESLSEEQLMGQQVEELTLENELLSQKLNEANQAKAKFVSVVTHELRIPMTAIKGYSDLLRTGAIGSLNEQQTSFLNIIRTNVDRMSALVSNLSDLSYIETGRMKLNTKSFELPTVIDEVLLNWMPKIEEKKQSLKQEFGERLHPVSADRSRVAQVLSTLLNNASRYTPEGGSLSLRVCSNGEAVRVEVVDSGIGIHEKDQPFIFTQFFRSEDPAVREYPGWGLSLCVARKIVELMGGQLSFQSAPLEGSSFWFSLPIGGDDEPEQTR
ncbi:MAG: sensor histidine kinase [Chloroflexi bacterium]|nr:MAG: sensor histidine kinase [Chloroflexota bacterium]